MAELKVLELWSLQELLKVNRQVVFDVLELIRETGEKEYIPVLLAWQKLEVRKVRERIQSVINTLEKREFNE
ncbi:MAG TPA: hypothetical protein GXX75_14945 [Clostridiales bacterium]|nr:hypothetical protein [Clostridiales bacterium]